MNNHVRLSSRFTGLALLSFVTASQSQLPAPPNSPAPVTNLEYYAQGNLKRTIVAPGSGNFSTVNEYDRLQRRSKTIDARGKHMSFSYNGREDITQVTDPRSLVTHYPRNGLGDMTALSSPDTGSTSHAYDGAGNLKTRLDSRGALATYSYDALNRLTSSVFGQSGQTQVFNWVYDQTGPGFSYGKGRLTSMQFPVGTTTFAHDLRGRVVSTTQTVNSGNTLTLTTGYQYDGAGRVIAMTYPSGRVLSIGRTGGVPSSLSLVPGNSGPAIHLISALQYEPVPGGYGLPRSWTWHLATGTLAHARTFDAHGRIVRYPLGGAVRDLNYDEADRIVSYTHWDANTGAAVAALNQSFVYDELSRLVAVNTGAGAWSFSYDDNGNRTGQVFTVGASTSTRAYISGPASNRLVRVESPDRKLAHDAAGNIIHANEGSRSEVFAVDPSGRISRVDATFNGQSHTYTGYSYNNIGQRILRTDLGGKTCSGLGPISACGPVRVAQGIGIVYVYGLAGQLLGEYRLQDGVVLREYVWLDDLPVAIIDGTAGSPVVYFLYADHLNTPRVALDQLGRQRWNWVAEPFGNSAPNEDPLGFGPLRINLRAPGQYHDVESGLAYNWHRSYDPSVGRYTQSDPIGLAGGINTYTYALGAPTMYADPDGLSPSPGDNSLYPPTHNCTCMTKCLAASHNEAYPACAYPAGLLGRMSRVPLAGVPIAYACQKVFVRRRCEMLCGDFCAGKAECPPAFRDP